MHHRPPLTALPPAVRLLLASQFAFNVGFYLVVPFLAVHLGGDLGLTGAAVGVVLGVRTFSQQGLFVVGGALADRYGTRPILLMGCLVRIAGFVLLGLADGLASVLLGAVLTGFAAALFSPAVEAALAHEGRELEDRGVLSRAELFGWDHLVGQAGSLVGPVVGAVLLGVDFTVTCLVAAAVFGAVFAANLRWAPRTPVATGERRRALHHGWLTVVRNRRFLVLAALFSTYLLSYNQLYLALPVELRRATGSADLLGWMFVLAAVLTVVLQVPLARSARRWGAVRAVPLGFVLMAAGFGVVAVATADASETLLPAVGLVVLLSLGTMIAVPAVRDIVPRLAGERDLGSYFGALASAGGMAVLLGSAGLGGLLTPGAVRPWVVSAVLPLVSAIGLAVLLRRHQAGPVSDDAPTASTDSATSDTAGASTAQGARST